MTELSWLFILTFPNGGSSALAQLLLTAPGTLSLAYNAEGQWLIPAMCAPLKRWDPETEINFDEVRRQWTEEARKLSAETPHDRHLIIEKSPPNMCRYKPLFAAFSGEDTTVAILTRDPLATCASWHSRYGLERIAKNWGFVGSVPTNEREYFEGLAELWLTRAAYLDKARQDAIEIFRYEDLTADPASIVTRLARHQALLNGVNLDAKLSVKDYPPQTLRNMNVSNIRALTDAQCDLIRGRLRRDASLVRSFGYSV